MAFTTWIRCRDKDTGHEFDVAEQAVDPAVHEVLEKYPPNVTGIPRPAKHRVPKATTPAAATTPKEK